MHTDLFCSQRTRDAFALLRTCAPPPLLYQLAATPSWIARVENEEDNIELVGDFVQHAGVMPPQLFLRLVAADVDSDGVGTMSMRMLRAGRARKAWAQMPSSHLRVVGHVSLSRCAGIAALFIIVPDLVRLRRHRLRPLSTLIPHLFGLGRRSSNLGLLDRI